MSSTGGEQTSFKSPLLPEDASSPHDQYLQRPLLPFPQVLASSSSSPVAPVLAASDRPLRRLRNNVSLACNECKVKKARCDGSEPCSRCTLKGLNCLFDSGRDRRRIRGIPTDSLILTERISQYQRLFRIMRNSSPSDAIRTLHHIRTSSHEFQLESDSSDDLALDELLQLVEQVQQGSSGSESLQYAGRSPTLLHSLNEAKLANLEATRISTQSSSIVATSTIDPSLQNSNYIDCSKQAQILLQPSHQLQNPPYTSACSQQPFRHSNSVSFDGSVTSSPAKDSNDVTDKPLWPAYVKTDLRQATKWLNQDMDEAARLLLQGPRSRYPRSTNSGLNTNQRQRLGTVPGQKINWLADFDNPLSDSDTLADS